MANIVTEGLGDSPSALVTDGFLQGTPTPPGECGLNAMIPLEMLITDITDSTFDTSYYSMAVRIDPADYNGLVAAHFQGCLRCTFGTPRSVELVDENGTLYSTITLSSNATYTRIRSTVTIDPSNIHQYRFKVPGNAGDPFELLFFDCKVFMEVQSSNAAKFQILLMAGTVEQGGNGSTEDENNQGAVAAYSATYATYSYAGLPLVLGGAGTWPFVHNIFLYEAAKWSGITEFELEVSGFHFQNTPCGCSANCQAALFDKTTNTILSASNLGPWSPGSTAALPEIKRVTFAAGSLTDGHEYEIRYILDPAGLPDGCRFDIVRAALYISVGGGTIAAQVYHKLSLERVNIAIAQTFNMCRYLHEPTKYNTGTTFVHEVSGLITTAGTGTSDCWVDDAGTSDVSIVSSILGGSTITLDATRTRWRTSDLTLTDGNRYYGHSDINGGTPGLFAKFSHAHQFLIAEIPANSPCEGMVITECPC